VRFTIGNLGEAALTWSASASDPDYRLDQTSGTLDGGAQLTVTVSNIQGKGTITVVATDAQHSPQTVAIICTV
jgi:hypothetical protein